MISTPNCVKCGNKMIEGFIADHKHGGEIVPSDWVEGEPVKAFWIGTKISNKQQYKVETYRCVNCGYLESYAIEKK